MVKPPRLHRLPSVSQLQRTAAHPPLDLAMMLDIAELTKFVLQPPVLTLVVFQALLQ
jgi:hypothetical protein